MKKIFIAFVLAIVPFSVHADTATIGIRDGSTLIGPFVVTLPDASDPPIALSPTGTTTTYNIPARSVLALLTALDATSTDFAITDLQYFSSFGSFIVNCISVPTASSAPNCFSWTYAINGTFPFIGMDAQTLQDGDIAYVIFGSQWQVSTDKSSVSTNEPFSVTAQKYDPGTGLYVPAVGEEVGAVQFDSNFVATEFATSTTNASGTTNLALPASGPYSVGIKSSGYFPNTTVTVSPPPAPSGGGGGAIVSHKQLDTASALNYLVGQQNADGSFTTPLLSDWVALAFSAIDPGHPKTKLRDYLRTASPSLSSVTDYERHAMALLALGINPYTDTATDYITPIANAFDGTQIGDPHLDNDDIFALFPLLRAGYEETDDIIQKTTAFILSAQNPSGAWDDSVDMTSAAIQALSLVPTLHGVQDALTRAEQFLRSRQQSSGGFENSFATSWAMQAIAARNASILAWIKNDYSPHDHLASLQESDGGVEPVAHGVINRVWATAYALPGALGKPWGTLLASFPKPSVATHASGNTFAAQISSSTEEHMATSTIPLITATSTAPVTPPVEGESSISPPKPSMNVTQLIPPSRKPVVPKESVPPLPPPLPVMDQTASVASAPSTNFFKKLWAVFTSLLSSIL